MKIFIILFLSIMAVVTKVCINDSQAVGSALSGSFGMTGYTQVYFFDILEDQQRDLLYFVGYFYLSPSLKTIIYKSDPNLAMLKVMSYDIGLIFPSIAIDSSKDYIYIQGSTTDKIFEIRTSDMLIERELRISSAVLDTNGNIEASKGFYFSFILSSIMQTCRWDKSTTIVDGLTLGVINPVNLAPISEDLLFFGSIDTADDQYYLINYNFSNPSDFVWKKSIACPTSGGLSKFSNAIISRNEETIYTMILYDEHFIFHKLSLSDGAPQNSGLLWNDSGFHRSYGMKEFDTFIAIQIYTTSVVNDKKLILVSTQNGEVLKEYSSTNSRPYTKKKN